MPGNKREVMSGVVFFLLAVALYGGSYRIVVTTADAMGPQFFPRTVAVLMGLLSVIQIAAGVKKQGRKQADESKTVLRMRGVATIGILFLYAVLVRTVGFMIMTAVYLMIQILLLLPDKQLRSVKGILVTAAVSLAVPAIIYHLFYHVFGIFLPAGILG